MTPHHFSIVPFAEYKNNKQQHYIILWIQYGSGYCYIDLERLPVCDHTIHFVHPGTPFCFEPGCCIEGYVITFNLEFLHLSGLNFSHQFLTSGIPAGYPGNMTSKPVEVIKLCSIMEMLCKEYSHFGLLKPRILSGWVKIVLLYLADLLPDVPAGSQYSRAKQVTARFYALLEKNFLCKKAVTDYANELRVAPEYLTYVIKQVSGYPASYHIKQRIVLEAKRLALYSNKSMKEIGYCLGFDEPAHFSKFFKVNCGKNFREFKRTYDGT